MRGASGDGREEAATLRLLVGLYEGRPRMFDAACQLYHEARADPARGRMRLSEAPTELSEEQRALGWTGPASGGATAAPIGGPVASWPGVPRGTWCLRLRRSDPSVFDARP